MNFKLILIILIMSLSIADLVLTGYYILKYKKWQPEKPYKLMELNLLLVFLWNKLGFWIGMFVGSVVILTLNFIVAKYAHWSVALLVLAVLIYTMFNHISNLALLGKLIIKYPSGYLPASIFGFVEGNNNRVKKEVKKC